eukprot:9257265-Pyramimonas_sp.AAC.1
MVQSAPRTSGQPTKATASLSPSTDARLAREGPSAAWPYTDTKMDGKEWCNMTVKTQSLSDQLLCPCPLLPK